jgi:hypothetical protein
MDANQGANFREEFLGNGVSGGIIGERTDADNFAIGKFDDIDRTSRLDCLAGFLCHRRFLPFVVFLQ